MQIDTGCARLGIGSGRIVRMRRAYGAQLHAVRGCAWITLDGDPRDIVLEPGQTFRVDVDRPVMVTALGGNAQLDFIAAPAKPPRQR